MKWYEVKCPENLDDDKAWQEFYMKQWELVANDPDVPEWLREFAKDCYQEYKQHI